MKNNRTRNILKVSFVACLAIVMLAFVACGTQEQSASPETYVAEFAVADTVKNNIHQENVIQTRGSDWGMVQVDTLTLDGEGGYVLVKEMKATVTEMSGDVSIMYTFDGTYTREDGTVMLESPEKAVAVREWANLLDFMEAFLEGDQGTIDSATDPSILQYFTTPYFSTGSTSSSMSVTVHTDGTFTFD